MQNTALVGSDGCICAARFAVSVCVAGAGRGDSADSNSRVPGGPGERLPSGAMAGPATRRGVSTFWPGVAGAMCRCARVSS